LTRVTPPDLRAETTPPNMLIVTHRDMRGAADRLRAYRAAGRVPGFTNPVVKVVTTDEIFDNFSGGMPDAMGIRNYIKYLFDNYHDANGNPRLAYILLLGDANEDFQNHASSQPDFVPSNLYFTRSTPYAFSTDEWFGHMDAQDQLAGHGALDVALGRLPAASAEEAAFLVDRVIGYETGAPLDAWRHRCILVADDENSSFSSCERDWPDDSEEIHQYNAANFLDIHKIYLTEFPAIAGVKPTSRRKFIDEWNDGAMVINYIGHGSPVQMADEQVFLEADVGQLANGLRLPVVMAFSCTIGQFSSPAGKCLSEKLLLHEGGGAIATFTASTETFSFPNERTCDGMFDRLFPDRPGSEPQRALGVASMQAKLFGQIDTNWQGYQEENSWKYNLLADPALRPATPRNEIKFEAAAPETLIAGARHALRGAVYNGGVLDSSFDGPVAVTIREPEVRQVYVSTSCPGLTIKYKLPGGPIYQGTVDAVNGKFEVSFRVPRYASTGTLGHADAYAHNDTRDAVVAADSLLAVVAPTLADSLALKPVDGAPRVDLGFKSGLQVVKPGDTVRARVADADGINILNTTNEGRQAILLDNLPVPIDVNEFFTFDHGGVDTTGTLLYPLPDLGVGKHRLVYKVSDSFGFTTLDTLQFSVTDEANYYAEAPFNFPNPFSDSTRFLFRISNRASIKLEVYTVSGKFVRRIEDLRDGGEVWVEWDGRDAGGGDVANGSYLYVATIDFVGIDRPPVVLRGALSRIR
ncbi:MAG TPA: C25 family cysteine peptidase, partial [Candidatus Krumholzibacteria bacterium]